MKVTEITCKTCGHVYGSFRPRCSACGTHTPHCKHGMVSGLCAVCTGLRRAVIQTEGKRSRGTTRAEREPRVAKVRLPKIKPDSCIVCRRRVKPGKKKSTRCPHCNELIHTDCLELHRDACLQFQFEREAELRKLGVK